MLLATGGFCCKVMDWDGGSDMVMKMLSACEFRKVRDLDPLLCCENGWGDGYGSGLVERERFGRNRIRI